MDAGHAGQDNAQVADNALRILWFHDAAAQDHVEEVRASLSGGVGVGEVDLAGRSALHAAASAGAEATLKVLLLWKAPVDCVNWKEACTPLHLAACHGHAACVVLLVSSKANVDLGDRLQKTALHEAAWGGHVDCVRHLLHARASAERGSGTPPVVVT